MTQPGDAPVAPAVVQDVLDALAAMARISIRHQAEMHAALGRSGLFLTRDDLTAALKVLAEDDSIRDFIPLDDGGLLITVTSTGLRKAG